MKAMILAAGLGQRLRPITEITPKPLVTILNKPIIEYNIELLASFGITDIIINLFHLGEQIEAALGDGSRLGVNLSYSREEELWGTGGGLKVAESFFDGEESFILMNGDTLIDLDLADMIDFHNQKGGAATMALNPKADKSQYNPVHLDAESEVVKIGSKIEKKDGKPTKSAVFCGVHILTPAIFEYLPPAIASCVVNYGYSKLISNDYKIFGYMMKDGYWNDLGTADRVLATNMELLAKQTTLKRMDAYSKLKPKNNSEAAGFMAVGENVFVGEKAGFFPPAAIGDNVVIKEGAAIGPFCVIGDNVTIERKSQISHSVIMSDTTVSAKSKLNHVLMAGKHKIFVEKI